jgi:hypothetical protein
MKEMHLGWLSRVLPMYTVTVRMCSSCCKDGAAGLDSDT